MTEQGARLADLDFRVGGLPGLDTVEEVIDVALFAAGTFSLGNLFTFEIKIV